jgi:hypothetical protein
MVSESKQPGGHPGPTHVGSWKAAELNAAAWMRHWGYADATAEPGGPDGGIDVRATGALGQVKNRPSQVGRPDIQRLLGAAMDHPGAELFFFSAGGFSTAAIEEANRRGIALFTFVLDGTMTSINAPARRIAQSVTHTAAPHPEGPTRRSDEARRHAAEDWSRHAADLRRHADKIKSDWQDSQRQADQINAFIGRNWRLLLAMPILLFAATGVEETFAGPADDVALGVVLVSILIALASLLIWRHIKKATRRNRY